MLSDEHLVASLQRHWSTTTATPTRFSGAPLETRHLDAWCDFAVISTSAPVRRHGMPDRRVLLVTVHCFAKTGADSFACQRIATVARETLEHQVIAVTDPAVADSLLGFLDLREVEVRDLSRVQADAGHPDLQHLVLTVVAVAQAVE